MAQSHNQMVCLEGFQQSGDPTKHIINYSSASSFNSAPMKVGRKIGFSFQMTVANSGSPIGHIYLQKSDDEERSLDVADASLVNWVTIQDSQGTSLDNAVTQDMLINFEDRSPMYRWLRVVYVASSGTITTTMILHVKQESGAH